MKRLLAIMLVLFFIAPTMASAGKTDEEGFEYGVVKDDGLTVKSLEHFASEWIDMEPCDRVFQEDNWYCYQYKDRGLKWGRHGEIDPELWAYAERYADALCSTGYYEPLKSDIKEDEVFFLLAYAGPGKVNETFIIRNSLPYSAAIVIASYMGNINIYYSIDITTADLEATAKRLDIDIYINGNPDDPWDHDCTECGFDGSCNYCGGTGQIYTLIAGTNSYTWQTCTNLNCQNGRCTVCGGDGMR